MLRVVKHLNNLNKMGKLTKNRKLSEAKIDDNKLYNLDEACSLLKDRKYITLAFSFLVLDIIIMMKAIPLTLTEWKTFKE